MNVKKFGNIAYILGQEEEAKENRKEEEKMVVGT
jgi:hypothetical protein